MFKWLKLKFGMYKHGIPRRNRQGKKWTTTYWVWYVWNGRTRKTTELVRLKTSSK